MASLEAAASKKAEAKAAATPSSALTRPFSELQRQTNVRERLLLNLYLLRGHAHQRAAAAAAAARGRLKQQEVAVAAAEAAAAEGEHSAATTAAAPLSKKQKAALLLRDSSSESMLFAPISHMLDGFVAAAARGAEEEAAKAAAAAAAAAEAEAGTAAAAAEAAPVPAPSEEGLLASVASDGARAAAAETAALWTRQLTNERRSLEAARARYSADLVQLAELGICPSAAAPRGLTRRLYLPMVEAVREEQLKVLSGVPGTDRRLYGPFLLLLPPEDYAAIALQGVLTETLKLSAKSLNGRGGGGRALVVEASGGRERGGLEVSDADAADLMARSLRDPLTAFDAALEASLPSAGGAAEAPGVGLRGPLGKAAAREPGFAPFTGLARHLGRGVRDTVSLGRLAAVVKREGTSQGKLVRLWDAARGRAAARGGAGLTPADEKELLDEFARVGSSTEAYVEGEFETGKRRRRGKGGEGPRRSPKGSRGTAESGVVNARYTAADGATGGAPRRVPVEGTLHDAVLKRINALAEEVERRKREEHLGALRRRHSEELAEYKQELWRRRQQQRRGAPLSPPLSSSPLPPAPPPTLPAVKRIDYFSQHDRERIDAYRTRALQAIDNVQRWTKDDAVKVGGALCHVLVESATVEVPIPDADLSALGGGGGGEACFVADMPLPVLSPLDLSGEDEKEGCEDDGAEGGGGGGGAGGKLEEEGQGGDEEAAAGEEEGDDGAAAGATAANPREEKEKKKKKSPKPKPKPKAVRYKPIETRGAGEIVRRNGRAFRVEPAFVRAHVRGGGKQVGGLAAHPQVMADAFTRGDRGAAEQLLEAGAAKADSLQQREEREEARRKGEAYYGGGGGGGRGRAGARGRGTETAGAARRGDARDLMAAFLGPFAAESGALGLVSDAQLPMLVPPVPWRSHAEGGYLVAKSSAVRCKERGLQRRLLAAADEAPPAGLSRVYAGLNALGALPWRINAEVLEAVERAVEVEGGGFALVPPTRNEPAPQRASRLARRPPTAFASAMSAAEARAGGCDRLSPYLVFTGAEFPQEFIARRRAAAAARKRNREAHSARCDLGLKLAVAREFARGGNGGEGDAIYFPHNLDFRGRAYPMHPHLNHLGNDVCRGLLTFGDGLELGEEGYGWLLVQVANSFGKGADKLPLEERKRFAEERLGALLATADDPWGDDPRKWRSKAKSSGDSGRRRKKLRFAQFGGDPAEAGARWWLEADAPWQLLATAKELRDAHRAHPGEPWRFASRLPVRVDGTCNGLQHYAALGRDEDGGRAVNLLPSERPSDVYSDVAAVVRRRVERDAADPDSNPKRARAARVLLAAGVDRGLVKQTVMTSVYGVTFVGAREQVTSRLRERGFFRGSDRIAAALASADPLASGGDASSSSPSQPPAFDDRDGGACYEAAAYGAHVTFDALAELFGGARAIMEWLGQCASLVAARDRAMAWTTPLGFPIAQPYRKRNLRVVQTCFQRLILDDESFAAEQPISMPRAGRAGGGAGGGADGEEEEEEEEVSSSSAAAAASSSSPPSPTPKPATTNNDAQQRKRALRSHVMKRRQRSAFPPNFIHALDSTHMLSTAARARAAGVAFAGVHDSFWTHAGTATRLNVMLRDAFVELHSRPLLEDLLAQMQAAHPDIEFPPLPARGALDLEKVRQSTYFFS
jgi:hypothetical protein